MKTISILDNTATHLPHLFSKGDRSNLNLDKIIVTDYFLNFPINNKCKIAWLVEPESIQPHYYEFIKNNYKKFDYVITFTKYLLDIIPNSIFIPFGSTFINDEDFKIYEKTKNISMIASDKILCDGHVIRHKIRKYVENKVDVFGRGIKNLDYKLDGLKQYRFSIAMENMKQDYYFTEKILDCFLTGTIPIYWGCPGIEKFFNINGILKFDSPQELDECLKIADEVYYKNNKDHIEENFNLAKKYINPYNEVYNFVDSL